MASCSFIGKVKEDSKVTIESEPTQVQVYDIKGNSLGTTPLSIDSKIVSNLNKEGVLALRLRKEGHLDKEILLDATVINQVNVTLEPLSSDHFKEWILLRYSEELDRLTNALLEVQLLYVQQEFQKSEDELIKLAKDYPNLPIIYILQADFAIRRKDLNSAYLYLRRALSISPANPTAIRMLKILEKRQQTNP